MGTRPEKVRTTTCQQAPASHTCVIAKHFRSLGAFTTLGSVLASIEHEVRTVRAWIWKFRGASDRARSVDLCTHQERRKSDVLAIVYSFIRVRERVLFLSAETAETCS